MDDIIKKQINKKELARMIINEPKIDEFGTKDSGFIRGFSERAASYEGAIITVKTVLVKEFQVEEKN